MSTCDPLFRFELTGRGRLRSAIAVAPMCSGLAVVIERVTTSIMTGQLRPAESHMLTIA
jgi:hypothetical protein